MDFNLILKAHKIISKKMPYYNYVLQYYLPTQYEIDKKYIYRHSINIIKSKGYMLNNNFIEIDSGVNDNCIDWDEIAIKLFIKKEMIGKLIYCLYLFSKNDIISRAELVIIFPNEKIDSHHFNLGCDETYEGNHFINYNGNCDCLL